MASLFLLAKDGVLNFLLRAAPVAGSILPYDKCIEHTSIKVDILGQFLNKA